MNVAALWSMTAGTAWVVPRSFPFRLLHVVYCVITDSNVLSRLLYVVLLSRAGWSYFCSRTQTSTFIALCQTAFCVFDSVCSTCTGRKRHAGEPWGGTQQSSMLATLFDRSATVRWAVTLALFGRVWYWFYQHLECQSSIYAAPRQFALVAQRLASFAAGCLGDRLNADVWLATVENASF